MTLNGDTLVSQALVAKVVGAGIDGIAVSVDRKKSYDADDMVVHQLAQAERVYARQCG